MPVWLFHNAPSVQLATELFLSSLAERHGAVEASARGLSCLPLGDMPDRFVYYAVAPRPRLDRGLGARASELFAAIVPLILYLDRPVCTRISKTTQDMRIITDLTQTTTAI
jgi:hypothetical protein